MMGVHELTLKCLRVVWSCETKSQLKVAQDYINLAAHTLPPGNTRELLDAFFLPIERCMAVTQYRIEHQQE
jgi:hypothetical protein